ncbi:MAG: hypothetical protein IJH12_04175 [Clostridia bacterium]|nr:hypothetical protein [Clostridia bacterium]
MAFVEITEDEKTRNPVLKSLTRAALRNQDVNLNSYEEYTLCYKKVRDNSIDIITR